MNTPHYKVVLKHIREMPISIKEVSRINHNAVEALHELF